jgi:hypothetical protein
MIAILVGLVWGQGCRARKVLVCGVLLDLELVEGVGELGRAGGVHRGEWTGEAEEARSGVAVTS